MSKKERIKLLEDEIIYIKEHIGRKLELNYWPQDERCFWFNHLKTKELELMALTHPI